MPPAEKPADEIQIELDLEGVNNPPAEITDETPGDPAVVDAPDELADLRKQLDDERRLRQDAESRANTIFAEKSASDSRLANEVNTRFAAQEQAIDARALSAKTRVETAKRELARAFAEQRFEDAADLQVEISTATTDSGAAAWEKNQLTNIKARAAQEMEAQNNRSRDPIESFIAQIPGNRSKQWLRDHPDIAQRASSSPSEAKRLYGYAQIAEANGNDPDSDSYFDSIEQQYGLKEAPVTETPAAATKVAPKAPGRTAAAAPSSRTAPAQASSRTVTLDDVVRKLTANDHANAKISFPDKTQDEQLKLYAQGLVISKQRDSSFRPDIRL